MSTAGIDDEILDDNLFDHLDATGLNPIMKESLT